jgi:hypothetical protein
MRIPNALVDKSDNITVGCISLGHKAKSLLDHTCTCRVQKIEPAPSVKEMQTFTRENLHLFELSFANDFVESAYRSTTIVNR